MSVHSTCRLPVSSVTVLSRVDVTTSSLHRVTETPSVILLEVTSSAAVSTDSRAPDMTVMVH